MNFNPCDDVFSLILHRHLQTLYIYSNSLSPIKVNMHQTTSAPKLPEFESKKMMILF